MIRNCLISKRWSHLGNHYIKSILIISHLGASISLCPTFPPYLAFMTFHQIAYQKKANNRWNKQYTPILSLQSYEKYFRTQRV